MVVLRLQKDIEAVLTRCGSPVKEGSRYRNRTYEEGVMDAIRWLTVTGSPQEYWPFTENTEMIDPMGGI